MLANEFNASKQYVDNLSLNTKRGLRQMVRDGRYPRGAPLGYYNDMRSKTIKIDRKTAPIVHQAFELYARGDKRLSAHHVPEGLGVVHGRWGRAGGWALLEAHGGAEGAWAPRMIHPVAGRAERARAGHVAIYSGDGASHSE